MSTDSDEQKELLQDPDIYLMYCKLLGEPGAKRVPGNINGNHATAMITKRVVDFMRDRLAPKPGLFDHMLPTDFEVGCRRPSFSHGYLEAIASDKTTVLMEPPVKFTKSGFMDSQGVEHHLDAIITATGYDQSHLPRFPKIVNGEDITNMRAGRIHPPVYMSGKCYCQKSPGKPTLTNSLVQCAA